MSLFSNYRKSITIKDHIKCKHIIAGDHSYYAGYYYGKSFEDCVMYLDKLDDHMLPHETDQLIIGNFCSIASGAKFMMGGNHGHNYNWITTYSLDSFDDDFDGYIKTPPKAHKTKGNTIIGNDVWIGAEAMIMPGVEIADGAVVAARAVVTRKVGAYEIWGGNPAKLIKKRFIDSDIEKLLQIKWWNWDTETLKRNLQHLRSDDVESLWQKFLCGNL